MRRVLLMVCVCALIGAVGCEDKPAPPPPPANGGTTPPAQNNNGGGTIVIDYDVPPSILIEAEAGTLKAPVAAFDDDPKAAGKYVVAPEGENHLEINKGGSATYWFTVEEGGDYLLWVRSRFCCACANSLGITANGEQIGVVEDAIYGDWHWVALRGKKLKLVKGKNMLAIANREDGAAWDQILLTQDAEYRPAGIEKADAESRTSGVAPAPKPVPGLGTAAAPEPPVATEEKKADK